MSSRVVWMAGKVLLVGVATTLLGVVLGFTCGIALPLVGGPPGVAVAGAVFCHFWAKMVVGAEHAVRCHLVGLFALLLAAGLIVVIVMVGSTSLGDQVAFRLALGVAGTVVGAALGWTIGDGRLAGASAVAGLVTWVVASLIAVPTFRTGPGIGPAMLFALLYAPGIGLTLWGMVMCLGLARGCHSRRH